MSSTSSAGDVKAARKAKQEEKRARRAAAVAAKKGDHASTSVVMNGPPSIDADMDTNTLPVDVEKVGDAVAVGTESQKSKMTMANSDCSNDTGGASLSTAPVRATGGPGGPYQDPAPSASSASTKAELKVQRRAKQEEQRARKAASMAVKGGAKDKPPPQPSSSSAAPVPASRDSAEGRLANCTISDDQSHANNVRNSFDLFDHLPAFQAGMPSGFSGELREVGRKFYSRKVSGSTERCKEMLKAFRLLIKHFKRPDRKRYDREIKARINELVTFFNCCRPLSVGMQNAVRFLSNEIRDLHGYLPDDQCQTKLITAIDSFLKVNITLAGESIVHDINQHIVEDDVILVYSPSTLIVDSLAKAGAKFADASDFATNRKGFEVIIVDSQLNDDAREVLQRLQSCPSITCTFVALTSLAFILSDANKVLLNAEALFANGYVLGPVGTSQVALMAKQLNRPVLVVAETYKLSDDVQTDSFVTNERNDASRLSQQLGDGSSANCLSIQYDVTPSEFVDVLITEIGRFPPSSVPTVVQLKQKWIL